MQAELDAARERGILPVLLDVRPALQFQLVHLDGAINVPEDKLQERLAELEELCARHDPPAPLIVVCRRGNASQLAVQTLRAAGLTHAVDVIGGMTRWALDVDSSMPVL
eukprot:352562-Chlamydomonas_euryale.AAC.9